MKLIIIFFLIVSFTLTAKAEVVKDIIVNNNDRISLNTIKTYGSIETGVDYTPDELNNILRNLYETNFFQDVSLKIEKNILIINVVENKLIQTININGIRSAKIEEAVRGILNLRAKAPFVESEVEKDLIRIKTSLSIEGYYFSNVTIDIDENTNNTVNLNFNIDLGDKVRISKIEFTGDKIVKDRTLRNLITIEESKFWKFLSKKIYLNEQNLLRDERLLKNFYLDEGYYDVVINASTAKLLDNNSFNVTYNINAGNIYEVNDTKLILPIDYDIKNFKLVEKLLNELKKENYSFFKIAKIVDAIDKVSLSREYDFITAEIIEDKISDNKIDITFKVSETEKLYVEQINILGNTITEENVIRNQLEVDEGDPYNELLEAKSINKIKYLNIFKSVNSEIIDGSTPETKIINISIEEKPTGEISLGAGVGSSGGTVGFGVSENNFLGKGIRLASALKLTADTVKGNLTINNPNYNYSGRALNTNIESTNTDKLKDSGYETSKLGVSLGTNFEEYENLYFSPNISLSSEKINTDITASKALRNQDGSFFETRFSYNLDYDLRNKSYRTTDGTRSVFSQGIPLISDNYSFVNSYEITKWHEFENKMVSDLGFFVKAINSVTDQDVKISNRIILPKKRLRGFESGMVGPRDGEDYVGGNYAMATNFEIALPNFLPESTKTDVGLFLDFGNLWKVDYSDSVDDSNKIRSTIGANTSWLSPLGPMTFVFSKNISKAATDLVETFSFRLGTTF